MTFCFVFKKINNKFAQALALNLTTNLIMHLFRLINIFFGCILPLLISASRLMCRLAIFCFMRLYVGLNTHIYIITMSYFPVIRARIQAYTSINLLCQFAQAFVQIDLYIIIRSYNQLTPIIRAC